MQGWDRFSRRKFLSLSAATGASLVLPPGLITPAAAQIGPIEEKDAVIAFGHVGPIADEGWTWSHHQGMEAVKAAFPAARYLEVENIPYSADASRIFRQFISEGAQMVFVTSNFADFLYDVAARTPEVAFMDCNGYRPTDNIHWYYIAHWLPSYVIGVAAGHMSKSGKLGYVGSFPITTIFTSTNAFLMGARSVNPDATLQAVMINSWFDPQAANQAGIALADNGCDFLFGIMDEAAYLQVAEERGIWAAMWNTDIRRYGPNAYVSSVILDWRNFYVEQTRKRLAGEWTGGGTILPFGGGVDRDAWGQNVPADVQEKADAVRTEILAGMNPFTGPIKDTTGTVRIAEGESMDEMAIYNWDWSVEGVSGVGG